MAYGGRIHIFVDRQRMPTFVCNRYESCEEIEQRTVFEDEGDEVWEEMISVDDWRQEWSMDEEIDVTEVECEAILEELNFLHGKV